MNKTIDYENIAKRMIALNSLGGYIVHYDGHRGLWWSDVPHNDNVVELCEHYGVKCIPSKRYDGILSILDCVDEFLPTIGIESLLSVYERLELTRETPSDLILETVPDHYLW